MHRDQQGRPPQAPFMARLIAALLAVSIILIVGFLEFGTNVIVVRVDGSETRTIEADPIITAYESTLDFACIQGTPCVDIARTTIRGVFPRNGVSDAVAILVGISVPYLLISVAAFLVLRMATGWPRIVLACGLSVLGMVLIVPLAAIIYFAHRSYGIDVLILDSRALRVIIMLAIAACTALTGGLWLFVRAYRGIAIQW
jgi:hypothetical protein